MSHKRLFDIFGPDEKKQSDTTGEDANLLKEFRAQLALRDEQYKTLVGL